MQLKFHQRQTLKQTVFQKLIKYLIILLIIIGAIFLLEKINFPSPNQNYKIDITDEIKKLK